VAGVEGLRPDSWNLVVCNHQSWVDILVLQRVLHQRIPLLKFYLKHSLIYVPFMGAAWWALDFPFMRRHSREYLDRHPEQRGRDLEITKKACERFSRTPTSVINFLEGTRFTAAKHRSQQSPFRHLLRPKAAGLALAVQALGDKFSSLLSVTIVYPDGIPTFWQFLCNRLPRVVVRMSSKQIPADLLAGDYQEDADYRQRFQSWVNAQWADKDAEISALLAQNSAPG
jgi:1-acyl-sn-glycerol-3-phosphate acyltransferase